MLNIDIVKSFEAEEMGKFMASIAIMKWCNSREITVWLLTESEDGLLHKGNMVWKNMDWQYDSSVFPHTDNWVLAHIIDIIEAVMAEGHITGYNVRLVIPAIEYGHCFEDYKNYLYYKAINFSIWSDFFDLNVEDLDDTEEANVITAEYLATYRRINFAINYKDENNNYLVNTIKVYYKNI